MAWSLIPLTSCKQTPKWDHGLKVTPGGQPKQHYAKKEKSEAANISGREASGVGLSFHIVADNKSRLVEGLMVSLTSRFPSLGFSILSLAMIPKAPNREITI